MTELSRQLWQSLSVGDVLRIRTSTGFGFAQCTGQHSYWNCPAIRVLPGVHTREPADLADRLERLGFFTVCPVDDALRDGTAEVVGRLPAPIAFPSRYRKASWQGGWVVIGDGQRTARKVLDSDEVRLSIEEPWPVRSRSTNSS